MAKTSYDKDIHPTWAWSLAIQGHTDKEISAELGIARSTLNKWREAHPEFDEAIRSGKDPADAKVERSLYERAIGYGFTERRVISSIDPITGKPTVDKIEATERFIPPDTTAQIYWLKNRRRDKWKDKWDVDISTEKEIIFNIAPPPSNLDEMGEDE